MEIKKILIVEDDKDIRECLKEILKEIVGGIEVIIAKDGLEGIQKFFKYKPDIVVLDLKMPRQDGYITAQQIFALSPSTPIIIASGDTVIYEEKLPPNVIRIIKKPFTIQEIEKAIMKKNTKK